jgi:primosomal protein N' (replication factor Y)
VKEVRPGVERIAEQLQRMAPGVEVSVSSAATGVALDGSVSTGIVVATPGALPAVEGGYATGVIIGADAGLGRAGTEVDAARLWFSAAAAVTSRGDGGRVFVVGDIEPSVRRALETWSPGDLSREAAAERMAFGLPPFRRVIQLEGLDRTLARASAVVVGGIRLEAHPEVTVLSRHDGSCGYLVSRRAAETVIDALRALQVELSASGGKELRMRVDGPLVHSR